MVDYQIYKPSEDEIETLKKFSLLASNSELKSDPMYIESDRITVVSGQMKMGKLNAMSSCACVKLATPHSFDKKFGIGSISEFLNIIDMLKNYEIRIYDKFLHIIDKDKNFKIQMILTPEEENLIPYTDVIGKVERGLMIKECLKFRVDWDTLSSLVKIQKKLKKNYLFFSENEAGNVVLKCANEYENKGENSVEIELVSNVMEKNLQVTKNGNYVTFELNIDTLIKDTYEISVFEKITIFSGLDKKHQYIFFNTVPKIK
mgnify:CR=1 FL=1